MYIPHLLDVHSDVFKCIFSRNGNSIPQKREPHFDERRTVLRRNGNGIPQKREQYCEETGTVFQRKENHIAKKREQYSEEILPKEKGDAKGTQIKTTGYNVCAERNLQKGHTLIISSAPPSNGAESAKINQTKAGNTGKRQPGFRRIQEIC